MTNITKELAPSCDWPTAIGSNAYNNKLTEQASGNVYDFRLGYNLIIFVFILGYRVAHVSLRTVAKPVRIFAK